MNLFIISAIVQDIPTFQIFRGIVPFIVSKFSRIVLMFAFPTLSFLLVGWWG